MKPFESESAYNFYKAILSLQTAEECRAFFEDICTVKEIQDLSQRLETALLLTEGKNYREISAESGVSTATIARVNKCMEYDPGGYKTVLSRIKEDKNV